MEGINLSTISTDKIAWPVLEDRGIKADMLRLDKIHPFVSGNKWFKLRYYLEEAKQQNKKRIVTYGGAWSNHIIATAAACQLHGINCTGIISTSVSSSAFAMISLVCDCSAQIIEMAQAWPGPR